jgi:RpiB/LacA/LacB family sugar-phosphate isomerase
MKIAIGSDHGGYPLNETVIQDLEREGHTVIDFGTHDGSKPDDYPDYARAVGNAVRTGEADRGIIICGSGAGAAIAANKIHGVRACLCHDTYSSHQAVEHDNMNVLCLGARIIGRELARELVRAFIGAKFSGEERHLRRLEKVDEMEREGQ